MMSYDQHKLYYILNPHKSIKKELPKKPHLKPIKKLRILNKILINFPIYFRKNPIEYDFKLILSKAIKKEIINNEVIEIDGLEYEREKRRLKRANNVRNIRNKKVPMSQAQKIALLIRYLPAKHPNITQFSIITMVNAYPNWSYYDLKRQLIYEKDMNYDNDQQFENDIIEYDPDLHTGFESRMKIIDILNYES